MSIFCFDTQEAELYGVNEAIMIHNFKYWLTRNKLNKQNQYDGRTWTYNSNKTYSTLFHFWKPHQIRRVLESLVKKGVLIAGNYNKSKMDRTKWYAFVDEQKFLEIASNGEEISENSTINNDQLHLTDCSNVIERSVKAIPNSNTQIVNPDSKPDSKQNVRAKALQLMQEMTFPEYRSKNEAHEGIILTMETEFIMAGWSVKREHKVMNVFDERNGYIDFIATKDGVRCAIEVDSTIRKKSLKKLNIDDPHVKIQFIYTKNIDVNNNNSDGVWFIGRELFSSPDKKAEREIIDYLNLKTGKSFRNVESSAKHIRARLKEGHTVADIMAVIDDKCSEWLQDKKMNQYLRPATLFNAEKFNQYIGQIGTRPKTEREKVQEWVNSSDDDVGYRQPASNVIEGEFFYG